MRSGLKTIINAIILRTVYTYSIYHPLSLCTVNIVIYTNVVLLVVIQFMAILQGALYIFVIVLKTGGCHKGCPNDSFLEGGANHFKEIGGKNSLDICHTGIRGSCCCGWWSWPVPVGWGSWWHLNSRSIEWKWGSCPHAQHMEPLSCASLSHP